MRVVFRVEGNTQIGMGHLSRCRVLADALAARGAACEFISGLFLSENDDAVHCAALLKNKPADWLVADHYGLGAAWEKAMRPYASKILVIDDLAREHDCDLLLDQNFFLAPETRYAGAYEKLLGPGYALLRPEIAELRAQNDRTPAFAGDGSIFVCFGGSDPGNMTARVVEALAALLAKGNIFSADVVVGSAYVGVEHLRAFCPPTFRLHVNHSAPEELMAKAELAIGAGGVMMWERAALGLSSLVISIAENQRESSEAMAAAAMIVYAGAAEDLSDAALQNAIAAFINDEDMRRRLREKSLALVDGLGASRVVERMYGG